jgi:hypothetical protein
MELIGKIKMIGETQSFGTNNFEKRELVVTTEEQYPQHILIEFVKDKCPILDKYHEGQSVKVHVNVRGREWINPQGEAKYFNSFQGWKIEPAEAGSAPAAQTTAAPEVGEGDDDLPF